MLNFFKGIVVGIGGIAPGLSGSVLLVLLGMYERVIGAIGAFFKDIRGNIKFLVPVFAGFGVGILLFSKIVDFLLNNYERYTRYAFLGMVVGTLPMFFKEVKKNGFSRKYYFVISFIAMIGIFIFVLNGKNFEQIVNPNLFQSVLLGVAVAASSIVPGIDSAVILSTLGLYELYVSSLANFNLGILLPAGVGLFAGAITISFIMKILLEKYYTLTFSIIFGLFISIIPKVLNDKCMLYLNSEGVMSAVFLIIGFMISYKLGKIKNSVVY